MFFLINSAIKQRSLKSKDFIPITLYLKKKGINFKYMYSDLPTV